MFRQFVRIGGIWGYGGIGRRRTFIALLEWKALMVDRFERKPTRKMNKSYRAGSNPAIPTTIIHYGHLSVKMDAYANMAQSVSAGVLYTQGLRSKSVCWHDV